MSKQIFDDPEMQEIFEGYLVETNELLENISQDLVLIENQPDDLDLLNRIFRSFHTIKGTSSFMGFELVSGITHHAEDILNKLRRSELKINQAIIDVLLEVQDWIILLLEKIETIDNSPIDYSLTIKRIDELKNSKVESIEIIETPLPVIASVTSINNGNKNSAVEQVLNNEDFFNSPGDFTESEIELLQKAFIEVSSSFKKNDEIIEPKPPGNIENDENLEYEIPELNLEEITELSYNEKTVAEAPKEDTAHGMKTKGMASESIRVDVQRLEILMDLSGELVLGRNRLAQLTNHLEHTLDNKEQIRDLIETTNQIDFITSEIQSAIMRMRMVPVGKLYQKAPRIVRDLSKESGKNIKLIVKGEETEIDRGIIEELNDPLVHMIRNSCDHGIESPEERVKLGKPVNGTITLDADQEGNNIVLRISDDGKGMDAEKLKLKGVEKGLITAEQAQQMTQREAFQLIFAPGFSTAVKVSAVSGRGVGMDVVRTNILKLKGLIEIESEIGIGTTFIIKLPLTLAIIQGLLVKVNKETYAIPLNSVIEVVALDENEVYTINKQEVIRVRKEVLPIIRLEKALRTGIYNKTNEKRYVVNVGLGMQRVGFVVDELLGQQEVVIKSLGEYLGSVRGIAGSTILGDGRVIMIIDVAQLLEIIYNNGLVK
jgi:two-component system chemotaxis sensor kinase CheA